MRAEIAALEREPDQITPCQAFTALFRLREQDARRWAAAAFMVGMAAAVALVTAIVLAIVGSTGSAISSGVGTIVTGAATGWLWTRRTEVQKEADEFLGKVKQYCPPEGGV